MKIWKRFVRACLSVCLIAASLFMIAPSHAADVVKNAPYTLKTDGMAIGADPAFLMMQTDGNLVLYKGMPNGINPGMWASGTYHNCQPPNICKMDFYGLGGVYNGDNNGNIVLSVNGVNYWNSETGKAVWGDKFGDDFKIKFSSNFPHFSVNNPKQILWSPLLGPNFKPEVFQAQSGIRGVLNKPLNLYADWNNIYKDYLQDGIVTGFATNFANPSTPLVLKFDVRITEMPSAPPPGTCNTGSPEGDTACQNLLMAEWNLRIAERNKLPQTAVWTVTANQPSYHSFYRFGVPSHDGFFFRIPDEFRNGEEYVVTSRDIEFGNDSRRKFSFRLSPVTQVGKISAVYNNSCLGPGTRCVSTSNDYNTTAFPEKTGWSDGKNYFNEWGCTSTTGVNYIARLNVLPLGSHGNRFQKDSFYMNNKEPAIYFTTTRYGSGSVFALKKTEFVNDKWVIYDVLDTKSPSGVSSQDGVYPNYIMNDYAVPGWGPVSPLPPTVTKIPAVSKVSTNPDGTSYPLEGFGPRGLTNVRNYLQPIAGAQSGGPEGRTCIHMNPKLLDYDSNGVPRKMIAYLFRGVADAGDVSTPCVLPDGVTLGRADYYMYKYDGSSAASKAKGWQLDTKPLQAADISSKPDAALKLAGGTVSTFLGGNWDGHITSKLVKLDGSAEEVKKVVLDCSASDTDKTDDKYTGVRFGETAGSLGPTVQFVFAGLPPGDLYPHMADPAKVVENQANLSATSVSTKTIQASGTVEFVLDQNTPMGGVALITAADDETNYMYGSITYNQEGKISLTVTKSHGVGQTSSYWKIYASEAYVGDLYYAFKNVNPN